MQFDTTSIHPSAVQTDCIIVGLFQTELTNAAKQLDQTSNGYLNEIIKNDEFSGKLGHTLLLHNVPHIAAKRVLLVGCGVKEELNEFGFSKILQGVNAALKRNPVTEIVSCLAELPVSERPTVWKARQIALGHSELAYQFTDYKTHDENKPAKKLAKLTLMVTEEESQAINTVLLQSAAIVKGMEFSKHLANQPGNVCTPTYLAEQALTLTQQYPAITTEVLEVSDMEKLGMGALLAVGQGSKQPPKLILMHYKGTADEQAPIALVGKGITFDTGGISIKPSSAMDEMKFDMSGAASVFGTLLAAAELQLPLNIIGVVPSAENMPGSGAYKPGDIVKSMSGQTIEITNTDAEGRLILCDALTYVGRYNPTVVLDIATLTGAIVIALGSYPTGLFTKHDELAQELEQAADASYDRVWRMPLWEDYQSKLDSNFADMVNAGDREGGSITAASFLARFTKDYSWAHLDIAGTGYHSGKEKGSTGRPVPLLVQFLLHRSS